MRTRIGDDGGVVSAAAADSSNFWRLLPCLFGLLSVLSIGRLEDVGLHKRELVAVCDLQCIASAKVMARDSQLFVDLLLCFLDGF